MASFDRFATSVWRLDSRAKVMGIGQDGIVKSRGDAFVCTMTLYQEPDMAGSPCHYRGII